MRTQTAPSTTPEKRRSKSLLSIRKRDNRTVAFDQEKITNAIFRSLVESVGRDRQLAERLSNTGVATLEQKYGSETVPTVEEVQDTVERVLLEAGLAKTAKAYILYRQKRAEIRKQKERVLDKEHIDEVDKVFDLNALRVLRARYLRKDEKGKLVESPKQLFTRVAVHAALPNLLYDSRVYSKAADQPVHPDEAFDPAVAEGKYAVGSYALNQYHLEALKRMFDRFNESRQMRVSWNQFLKLLGKGEFDSHAETIAEFYKLMVFRKFLPNTPAIANFGNVLGMGSACFVLGVDDSIESIMGCLKKTAIVFKAGGGMGYNFSKLRPEGDYVSSTSGIASGPISFMTLFDTMTEVIKQGGIRRGANMGILNSSHPDIEKFVTAKKGNKALRNFNISALIMPDFWESYRENKPYPLINPRTGEVVREVNPRLLFDMIVYQAWESAEPGVIFYDHVNKYNPFLKSLGPIITTNPCGEVLLYPNESCNLGSINVWAFCKEDESGKVEMDWDRLQNAVRLGTRFLDNVIDVNKFPLKDIEEMTLATRKIGLGVMGLADLLIELGLAYNSEEGRRFMEELMEFINYHSKIESIELSKERGPVPYYDQSFYPEGRLPFRGFDDRSSWHFAWDEVVKQIKEHGVRNGYTTVIAPTGSISMIAGCSSGMEPIYSLVYEKNVKVGSFYYVDPVFEKLMTREGLYDEQLIKDVSDHGGSLQRISYIPAEMKRVFVTTMDINPEHHIRALGAFQKWVDSSISKTNNFPANATVDDMRESYLLAYELGCKDVTVFRDTSIKDQVLVAPKPKPSEEKPAPEPPTTPSEEPAVMPIPVAAYRRSEAGELGMQMPAMTNGGWHFGNGNGDHVSSCPQCEAHIIFQEGCGLCPDCGWTACA